MASRPTSAVYTSAFLVLGSGSMRHWVWLLRLPLRPSLRPSVVRARSCEVESGGRARWDWVLHHWPRLRRFLEPAGAASGRDEWLCLRRAVQLVLLAVDRFPTSGYPRWRVPPTQQSRACASEHLLVRRHRLLLSASKRMLECDRLHGSPAHQPVGVAWFVDRWVFPSRRSSDSVYGLWWYGRLDMPCPPHRSTNPAKDFLFGRGVRSSCSVECALEALALGSTVLPARWHPVDPDGRVPG